MQIHELNNFSGNLDEAYFIVDDGSDTGKIKRSFITAAEDAAIEAVNDRIDNIVSSVTDGAEVIDARIGANGITYTSLGKAIRDQFDIVNGDIGVRNISFVEITGKYITKNNAESSSASFNRSGPIEVLKGEIVEFTATGYMTNIAMIALTDADETYYSMVQRSVNEENHTYVYEAVEDCYIVVSYANDKPKSLVFKTEESNARLAEKMAVLEASGAEFIGIDADLSVIADKVLSTVDKSGKYISKNGSLSSSASFGVSSVIALEAGQMISFNATGYNNVVALLARVNDDSTYTPLIVSEDSNEHIFNYLAAEDMNVVISTNLDYATIYSIFTSRIDSLDMRVSALESDWFAFATMGVIGDSLAVGSTNYPGGVSARPLYSWGKVIEREHGIDCHLFASGGATTRSWLTNSSGLAALQADDILDLYVIGLGVNDVYSLGAGYLGSIADVNVGSEGSNPDTYYGNYSKIIAAIKSKSPRAKIVCLTNPKASGATDESFNQAIKDIVALYTNTYLIDLAADPFYSSAEFTSTWLTAHSTAVGYKLIAADLYRNISELIRTNLNDFLDIQWIIENHA